MKLIVFLLGDWFILKSYSVHQSREHAPPKSRTSPEEEIKTLRIILAALILSITILIFRPLWSPQAGLEYDFMRIFLIIVASFAAVATYVKYKRMLKMQKRSRDIAS